MDTGKGRSLPPLRIPSALPRSERDSHLPDMPERIPEYAVAPDRSSTPEGRKSTASRTDLFYALQTLNTFWDAKLIHLEGCVKVETQCSCGLDGLRKYLKGA